MSVPIETSMKSWLSPSNVTMAALVAFLFVGTATDWKILPGRAQKSRLSAKSGVSRHASPAVNARVLRSGPSSSASDPVSDVADRRNALHEMQPDRREIE